MKSSHGVAVPPNIGTLPNYISQKVIMLIFTVVRTSNLMYQLDALFISYNGDSGLPKYSRLLKTKIMYLMKRIFKFYIQKYL
jgi:hypothetical protein